MSDTVKVRELWYINKRKLLNRAIAAATWLPNMGTEPVSHTSLWEPWDDKVMNAWTFEAKGLNGAHEIYTYRYMGQCWTSTTRGDDNGTVVRPASGVLDHPENWYYTEHEVARGDGPETKVWNRSFTWAKRQAQRRVDANKGYAFRDLFRYIMPLWLLKATRLADNGREICSEHVESWAVDMGVLKKRLIRSPRRLCKDIVLATGSPLYRLHDGSVVRDGKWRKVK